MRHGRSLLRALTVQNDFLAVSDETGVGPKNGWHNIATVPRGAGRLVVARRFNGVDQVHKKVTFQSRLAGRLTKRGISIPQAEILQFWPGSTDSQRFHRDVVRHGFSCAWNFQVYDVNEFFLREAREES